MQIVILMAFMVAAVSAMAIRDGYGFSMPTRWAAPLAAFIYVAVAAIIERLLAIGSLRRIRASGGADDRGRGLLDFRRVLVNVYLLAGLAVLLIGGLGRCLYWSLNVPLLGEALMIAPFAAALLVGWWMQYPSHQAFRMRLAQRPGGVATSTWTRWQFLKYNFRFQFLFIAAPLGLIFLLQDALILYAWPWLMNDLAGRGWSLSPDWQAGLQTVSLMASSMMVVLIAPAIIVRVWRTRPLPEGELRSELEQALRRLKLRCRQILLWESDGVIANAAVLGVVAPVRYVLLSDALLTHMGRKHLEAIFAHEAGHIMSHHLFYCLLFSVNTVLLAGAGESLVFAWTHNVVLSQACAMAMLAAMWLLLFGRISRAMERQSDVTGAWLAGESFNSTPDADRVTPEGAAIFAQALQQVAWINGMSAASPNWRHGSIQSRIGYIFYLGARGGSRREIDGKIRWIKLALWAAFAVSVAATAAIQIANC